MDPKEEKLKLPRQLLKQKLNSPTTNPTVRNDLPNQDNGNETESNVITTNKQQTPQRQTIEQETMMSQKEFEEFGVQTEKKDRKGYDRAITLYKKLENETIKEKEKIELDVLMKTEIKETSIYQKRYHQYITNNETKNKIIEETVNSQVGTNENGEPNKLNEEQMRRLYDEQIKFVDDTIDILTINDEVSKNYLMAIDKINMYIERQYSLGEKINYNIIGEIFYSHLKNLISQESIIRIVRGTYENVSNLIEEYNKQLSSGYLFLPLNELKFLKLIQENKINPIAKSIIEQKNNKMFHGTSNVSFENVPNPLVPFYSARLGNYQRTDFDIPFCNVSCDSKKSRFTVTQKNKENGKYKTVSYVSIEDAVKFALMGGWYADSISKSQKSIVDLMNPINQIRASVRY